MDDGLSAPRVVRVMDVVMRGQTLTIKAVCMPVDLSFATIAIKPPCVCLEFSFEKVVRL
jgi:hypothetical protein